LTGLPPPGPGSKRGSRALDDSYMIKLSASSTHKDLLQVFEVRGTSASKIFASADFAKFVTVDDAGLLYILEEIVPAHLK